MKAERLMVEAGRRDKLVTIQRATDSTSTTGFAVEGWAALGLPVWMAREDVEGDERFATDMLRAQTHTNWVMPYQANMDPELLDVPKTRRLVYQGRVYDIVSAITLERHRGIKLKTLAGSKI